jgi:hypothetical protein
MKWLPVVVAAALSGAVWLLAATHGHAVELLWLPGVVIAAAWPRAPHR